MTRTAKGTFSGVVDKATGLITFGPISIAQGASIIVGGNNDGSSGASAATWNGVSLTRNLYLRNDDQSRCWIFSGHGLTAGTGNLVITVALKADPVTCWVSEYTGLVATSTIDQTKTASGSSTAPSTGATGTTTQADELLIGNISYSSATTAVSSWGNSFAAGQNSQYASNNMSAAEGYLVVSATGAYTAAATLAASESWSAGIATYKLAAGGTTITPAQGALTATGQAPTVTVSDHKTISPGAGVLASVGYAVALIIGTVLSPATGALAATGYEPTVGVAAPTYITPAQGELTLAGYAPSVAVSDNKTITPGVGELALTGYAPSIAVSDHKSIAPDAGALSLTGYAASVSVSDNQVLTPDAGALALTGQAPALVYGTVLSPAQGTLALAGYAPTVFASEAKTVEPGCAALVITGFAPSTSVSDNKTVVPEAGILAITGYSASLTVGGNTIITPNTGTVTISGYAPVVWSWHLIPAGSVPLRTLTGVGK